MINIHTRLAQLAAPATVAAHNNSYNGGSEGPGAGGEQLQFRRPRSFPGGGLYKQLDDVRPVLQVLYCTALHVH